MIQLSRLFRFQVTTQQTGFNKRMTSKRHLSLPRKTSMHNRLSTINTFLIRLRMMLKMFSPSSGPGLQLFQPRSLESQFGHLFQVLMVVKLLVPLLVTSLKLVASVSSPLVCSRSSQMEEVSVLSVKEMI
jgi:hypothetical protein